MTEYTLSVVQICPEQHKDVANAIDEDRGYGPNNLSVKLIKQSDNSIWWGCRADWIASVYDSQMVVPTDAPQYIIDALSAVISSAKEGVDANTHWLEVLQEQGMVLADIEAV